LIGDRFLNPCPVRCSRLLALLLAILVCTLPAWASSWTEIHTIQAFDSSKTSPYMGDDVTTTGIVIAVLSDGFYIEDSGSTLDGYSESWDSDTCTSEGIYVYTGTGNVPSTVVLKAHVLVYGLVEASNSSSYGGTQIAIADPSTDISVLSTGNSYPNSVNASVVTQAIDDGGCKAFSADSFGQWLPFEGMLINVPSSSTLLVTQGTGGTATPASQTATSNGQFWGVITTTTRPFRATGIDVLDPAYANAPSTVTTWSGNPQLLLIDSKSVGGTALNAAAGTEYAGSSNLVGIVDYHISSQGYTALLLTSAAVTALSEESAGNTPTAAHKRLSSDQITFATLDLNSLVYTETNRMTKLANAVVNYMHSPDVIAVQGADANSLSDLRGYIATAGGPTYSLSTVSSADSNGLYNAFLVNPGNFDGPPTVSLALCGNTVTLPVSGTTEALFDRCPLVLTAKIPRKGISDFTLYAVNANLMDRAALSATATTEDTQYRREQQAGLLATQLLEPLETAGDHVMVMGGFNSFEFSDGYVDTMGIVDGQEASDVTSSTVWTYDTTYNSSTLVNSTTSATNLSLSETNPATSRYTYVESGSAEQPDHILYTGELSSLFTIDYARIGADFPVIDTYDTSTVARASSHDAVIAYFTVPYNTMTTVAGSPNPSIYDQPVTFTATVCVVATSTSTTCASGADTPDGTVTFTDTTTGTTMGTATLNSSGVATLSYSALTVGTHTVTAAYSGSETNLGYQTSSGTTSQTVNQDSTTTTLATSPNPSYYGEPVTLTATVAYVTYGVTPTGTVTFTDTTTGNTLGTGTLSSGVATLTVSTLSIGAHLLQASYGGDTTNATSTSNTVSQAVNTNTTTITVTSSENPSYYGDGVTFTATLVGSYGTPTGTISFIDTSNGNASLGSATLSAGAATYTASAASSAISSLSMGTHVIEAVYTGDGTNAAVNGTVSQVVNTNASTLVLSSNNNPSYYGDSVTFTVVATADSGTPTGTLIIYNGTTALGSASINSGTATFSIGTLPVGTDAISAVYGGDGTHAAATSNIVSQVVQQTYTPVSTLACSPNPAEYGTTVTCTDTVASTAGTPTGTVTFYDGTTVLATASLSSGVATYTSSSLAVGSHAITADYARNGQYLASVSNTVTEIIVSTFSLSASPASFSIYTGEKATSTITVTPGSGFTLDVALVCSGAPANTTCTLTPSTVTGGSGTSTLTIQTTAPSQEASAVNTSRTRAWPLVAGLLLLFAPKRWRRWRGWTAAMLLVAALALSALAGCGGSGTLTGGTAAGSYPITVTGTAVDGTLTITETTTVTVNVQSMF
jgi:hypothetical protein